MHASTVLPLLASPDVAATFSEVLAAIFGDIGKHPA
jgi:hypothetical protein